jgi:hypothetical protein
VPASDLARGAQGARPFGLTRRAYSLRAVRSLFAGLQIEIFLMFLLILQNDVDEFFRTGIDESFCVRLRQLKKQKT